MSSSLAGLWNGRWFAAKRPVDEVHFWVSHQNLKLRKRFVKSEKHEESLGTKKWSQIVNDELARLDFWRYKFLEWGILSSCWTHPEYLENIENSLHQKQLISFKEKWPPLSNDPLLSTFFSSSHVFLYFSNYFFWEPLRFKLKKSSLTYSVSSKILDNQEDNIKHIFFVHIMVHDHSHAIKKNLVSSTELIDKCKLAIEESF